MQRQTSDYKTAVTADTSTLQSDASVHTLEKELLLTQLVHTLKTPENDTEGTFQLQSCWKQMTLDYTPD